jgi:hypothetical protein
MEESTDPKDFTPDLAEDLDLENSSHSDRSESPEYPDIHENEPEVFSLEKVPSSIFQNRMSMKENINIFIKEVIIRDEKFFKYAVFHILVYYI